jgi:FKBP-type peptidyl-prolyl cis-trans isomerase
MTFQSMRLAAVGVIIGFSALTTNTRADEKPALATELDRTSYAVGVAFGRSLKQQGTKEVNIDLVIKGIRDAVGTQPLLMSEDEYRTTHHAFQQEMISKLGKARDLAARDNKEAGDACRAGIAKQVGFITLPSGLQYKVLTAGTGPLPTEGDTITAHYRGTLIDGIEVDSTYRRNQPATFPLKAAIAGWRQAIPMMPTGSKWQLVVPPELAYSKQGAGKNIGPNATLIFEIELISAAGKS